MNLYCIEYNDRTKSYRRAVVACSITAASRHFLDWYSRQTTNPNNPVTRIKIALDQPNVLVASEAL